MLRSIIEHGGKSAPANMKVAANAKTGMGVVITDGQLAFPTAATAADVYFLQKARVLSGTDAARTDVSDYLDSFNTLKAGDLAVAENYDFGEEFATDQYDATDLVVANVGKRVEVGTDGKLALATGSSKYIFVGLHNDGGHTLARIRVSDTAAANESAAGGSAGGSDGGAAGGSGGGES